ncbi:DMT family transporter [Paenibacillus sp. 481]|nr:DMT family transporter [Paenibacillus sp. 481]
MLKKVHIYAMLCFVMLCWGLNVTATKLLVTSFAPVTITAFRILAAALCVFAILSLSKQVRMLTKREFVYVLLGSLLNVVAHHYFLSIGLSRTSAVNGGLIIGTGPLLTTIFALLFLGSKLTLLKSAGIILGFSGVSLIVLVSNGGMSGVSIGDLYVFLAMAVQAASFILIKRMSATLDPRLMTGYMLLLGSVFLFMISLIVEPQGLATLTQGSVSMWVIFFASACIATGVGHMMYNYAIGLVGTVESAIFINLSPFFALIGSAVFLGEQILLVQIVGFVLIIAGVLCGSGALEERIRSLRRSAGRVEKVTQKAS